MKTIRRITSILLSLLMVFSLVAVSAIAETTPLITKQPTVVSPSVEVSFPEEVTSYQWYKMGCTATEGVIDAHAAFSAKAKEIIETTSIPAGLQISVLQENSYYDTVAEVWVPSTVSLLGSLTYFALTIKLETGASIDVESAGNTPFGDCALFDVENPSVGYYSVSNDDGTYTITVEHSATFVLCLYPVEDGIIMSVDDTSASDHEIAVKASGSVTRFEPVAGETSAELSSVEYGEKYICDITLKDETVITSDVLNAIPEIITQPTADSPFVDVTFKDNVVSYQWNKFEIVEKVVTDSIATPTVVENAGAASYDSKTELWTPVVYDSYKATINTTIPNRYYFDNIDIKWENIYIFCFNTVTGETFDFAWPGVRMTQIEDTHMWYYDVPEECNAIIFNNGAIQTRDLLKDDCFANGKNCYDYITDSAYIYTESVETDIYELELFEISLKQGETITFEFSGDINGETVYSSETPNIHMDENGVYSLTAEYDVTTDFYFESIAPDTTVRVTMSNVEVYTPVEGADKPLFIPEESATYACIITYEDGVTLVSDPVALDADNTTFVEGDINGDGAFDMFDYLMVKSIYFKKHTPTALEAYRADVNSDDVIDMFDYLTVKNMFFKK